MSDLQNAVLQPGQAGQPVSPSTAQPAAQPAPASVEAPVGAPQQYVTKAEAEQMVQKAVSQAQSLTDKAQQRILNEVLRLKTAGITATPEQVKQMIVAEEAKQPLNAPIEGQPAAQQSPQIEADPVVRKSISIMTEITGSGIPEGEPEWAMIKPTEDPEEFLASVREASNAYAKRVGNLSNPARIPSLSSGTPANVPVHTGLNSTDTIGLAIKEQFQNK